MQVLYFPFPLKKDLYPKRIFSLPDILFPASLPTMEFFDPPVSLFPVSFPISTLFTPVERFAPALKPYNRLFVVEKEDVPIATPDWFTVTNSFVVVVLVPWMLSLSENDMLCYET